jgi:hypothetical protein
MRQGVAGALAAAVVGVVPAQAAAVGSSSGFTALHGAVRCAVRLPREPGLLCAATAVKTRAYDGRGVVRLLASGRVSTVPAGSDLLLEIDGDRDRTARPALAPGRTWRHAGFVCTSRRAALTCARRGHGFTLSAVRVRRF